MVLNGREILVEIKSVNHRYNELYVRLPRAYLYLEEPLKKLVQENISRGKTEVNVTITNVSAPDVSIEVNPELAKGYVNALRKANNELGLMDDLSLSRITRISIHSYLKPRQKPLLPKRRKRFARKAISTRVLTIGVDLWDAKGIPEAGITIMADKIMETDFS